MLSIKELKLQDDIRREIKENLKQISGRIQSANRSYIYRIDYVFQSFVKFPYHQELILRKECYAGIIKKVVEKGFKVKLNDNSITISWESKIDPEKTENYLNQFR